ncbi:MAG: fibrillarin-like rRNA/tRNA 2'-O-methyltransferase [Nitrososphaeraceae archaeon]
MPDNNTFDNLSYKEDHGKDFDGYVWININGEKQLATFNLVKGNNVYGEKLILYKKEEYRLWDPFRSKLAASLLKGLQDFPIKTGLKILYLGASTGTTVSHISDIIGNSGVIFAIESSMRVARELIENVADKRENIIPIIEDARKPGLYFSTYGEVDVVYCDIAQPDQTDIAINNCNMYLRDQGKILLVIKTRSIDVTQDPKSVILQESKKLQNSSFNIEQILTLDPYDKDHGLIHATYNQRKS